MSVLRKYILLPSIIGSILYGMLQMSYFVFLKVFNHEGLSFILKITTFAIFSTVFVPYIIKLHYKINLWEMLHIERSTWIIIAFFSIISKYSSSENRFGRLR